MNKIESLWSTLFSLQDQVGLTVNLLIVGLFVAAVINVIKARRDLQQERDWIKGAGAQLLNRAACPTGPVEAILDFLGVPLKSLLGRRIARVVRLRSAGVGHREVLQQVTAERIEGYGALARYVGVILTMLGLFGTVLGMSLALANIQGALSEVNDVAALRELTQALGGALRGMKTAFGCTMAGILTAILLSAFNHMLRQLQSAVSAELEEFIVCELLPALESVDPGADEAAKAFANALSGATGKIEQLRELITSAVKGYDTASQQMGAAANEMQSAVRGFAQTMAQVANNQQDFTQTMGETRKAVTAMTELLDKQFTDLREFTLSTNQLMESRLAAIEGSTQTNLALQENLKTLAENFQPAITGYHEMFQAWAGQVFAEFKTALNQTLSEISQTHSDKITGQLSHGQRSLEEAIVLQGKQLNALAAQNQTSLTQLSDVQQNAWQSFSEQHQRQLAELLEPQHQALRAFSDLVVDVNLNLGSLFDHMAAQGNGYPRATGAAFAGGAQ